jgi:hypothetical protein
VEVLANAPLAQTPSFFMQSKVPARKYVLLATTEIKRNGNVSLANHLVQPVRMESQYALAASVVFI